MYPSDIYEPRVKANKAGVVYDADKKTVLFVEDVQALDDNVVAIQETLGENPQGGFDTVADRLNGFSTGISEYYLILCPENAVPPANNITTHFVCPPVTFGKRLVGFVAFLDTADSAGDITINAYDVSHSVDAIPTPITIYQGEVDGHSFVDFASGVDAYDNEIIRFDVTGVTDALGLKIWLQFSDH